MIPTFRKTMVKTFSALALLIAVPFAQAMEFRIHHQSTLKLDVVIGEGPIVEGDARRFIEAASKADRDREGHVVLVLNSPGGSVTAAFDLVRAMDKIGVYTLVPDNARCASACASIVYPSGTRREVVGDGALGFHSCYKKTKENVEESSFCNEVIAEHAISRGLAHASVSLFVENYGAREIAWVDRSVACTMLIGMCRPTLRNENHHATVTFKPSFDCVMARTFVEKIICSNPELAKLDTQMAIAYFSLRMQGADRKTLLSDQRGWLSEARNACDDFLCLVQSYQQRIAKLNSMEIP